MAITPKQILDTAVSLGRGAVNLGLGLLRRDEPAAPPTTEATPSGAPATVGAAKPGASRGPKSATAPTPAVRAKAPAAKPSQATKTAAAAAQTPPAPEARPKAEPARASRKAGATNLPS